MSDSPNIVEAEWFRVLADELNNNILMNTPKGKTAFAAGMAFVVGRLMEEFEPETLDNIYQDLEEFLRTHLNRPLAAATSD